MRALIMVAVEEPRIWTLARSVVSTGSKEADCTSAVSIYDLSVTQGVLDLVTFSV